MPLGFTSGSKLPTPAHPSSGINDLLVDMLQAPELLCRSTCRRTGRGAVHCDAKDADGVCL